MTKSPPQKVTVKQLANHWNVSEKTIRQWVQKGILPHYRLPGGGLRFDLTSVQKVFHTEMTSTPAVQTKSAAQMNDEKEDV